MLQHVPQSIEELKDAIIQAGETGTSLALCGHNSQAGIGRPVEAHAKLSLKAFDSIVSYHASELVMVAGAGLNLDVLRAALAENNQYMPFEPFDYRPLLGQGKHVGTLGGMIGCGFSGSRRVSVGSIRDFVHGYKGVSGKGEIHKAGGSVFKTVTGYDMPRLMVGSFGTLTAMYEVAFKVLPKPQTSVSLLIKVSDDWTGVKLMTAALGSACDVSGAALLPSDIALPEPFGYEPDEDNELVILRLEGFAPSIAERRDMLRTILDLEAFDVTEMEHDESSALWAWLNQAGPMLDEVVENPDIAVWRISCPASDGAYIGAALLSLDARLYYDWGGGLIHAAVPIDMSSEAVRASFSAYGGHATLMKAPKDLAATATPFQPLFPAEEAISRRIKHTFDPLNVLNPKRMFEAF